MIFEKVREIISEQLEIDPETIQMQSRLGDDLKADSVDIVSIIMSLEAEYDLEFPFDDLGGIETVADAVNYIQSKQ